MADKTALIISLHDDCSELAHLASSLGYAVDRIFVQPRLHPDAARYIGPGKIAEIKEHLADHDVECAIVNGELRPSQWYNLERDLQIRVYDRLRLILDIFADRAQRKEARLQVKLASLRYERPYIRELIHRTKTGEHPGFLAGGEYQVASYYERIKKQMKNIKAELTKIEEERKARRQHRLHTGFYLVSLVGYTNAGKSCLLNQLTDETVKVDDQLFSTLSTTTRRLQQTDHDGIMPLLVTDTVGFIQDLPHWMVDAFHSTLEEIDLSDVIVLLVDASDDIEDMQRKALTSLQEVTSMHHTPSIVIGFSKSDLLTPEERASKREKMRRVIGNRPSLFLSARTGHNIDRLIDMLYAMLPEKIYMEITFPCAMNEESVAAVLRENVELIRMENSEKDKAYVCCSDRMKESIKGRLEKQGLQVRFCRE
ncbi:MAG: GTPase HflX [Candidatus Thermoplasmatota archaeon]|nr:GTPase HflX [Candidatus Thermoplasmatota archaeon]